ncbi:hypothetical protein, partial [Agriterribacter sp.]|uniref:hypothetical protein n=1 Tax=Agriterribacter sp. TaxID=2821509 RepID=UPI002C0772E4
MYKSRFLFFIAGMLLLLSSCRTGKELALFQDLNSEQDAKVQQVRTAAFDPLRLQTDDQLQIVIS